MDSDHRWMGETLWGDAGEQGAAGVAWEWVQIQQGVVAMANPLRLVTNLQVCEHGELLDGIKAALRLNVLVHALPWQREVARALGQMNQ